MIVTMKSGVKFRTKRATEVTFVKEVDPFSKRKTCRWFVKFMGRDPKRESKYLYTSVRVRDVQDIKGGVKCTIIR